MLKRVSFLARAAMTLLLTVLCSTGAWATITGAGTQDNPYVIADANDWATFVDWINYSSNNITYANKFAYSGESNQGIKTDDEPDDEPG